MLVRITATRKEAIVRVVDQGPGLAEDELERVFEPFYRRSGRRTLGRGARPRDRARLRRRERRPCLGRVAAGAGRDVRARAAGRRGARGAARMNGQRILVVDDEPQILRALQTTLRGAGYTVDSAATAERGAHRGGRAPARGGDPRPRPPGRERHRRLPRAAHVERRARDRALGRRRGAGEDRRARRGRRRLRHEAVQRRRAARAAARGPAATVAEPGAGDRDRRAAHRRRGARRHRVGASG